MDSGRSVVFTCYRGSFNGPVFRKPEVRYAAAERQLRTNCPRKLKKRLNRTIQTRMFHEFGQKALVSLGRIADADPGPDLP